jgi:hypothetical protein
MLYLMSVTQVGQILRELEALINDPKTKEADLQAFLEEYPELVAGGRVRRLSFHKRRLWRDGASPWKADFVLALSTRPSAARSWNSRSLKCA